MTDATSAADRVRLASGFLSVAATVALGELEITVFDPFSTLVSATASLGAGTVLWPGTIIQIGGAGDVRIGAGVVLFPGARIVAEGGTILIGDGAEIGEEGGFTIKTGAPGSRIEVGSGARLLGGGALLGDNAVGRGAQVLGPIRLQNCRLGDGGTYRDPDPDQRGGVLKGSGAARGLEVPQGHVIQAFGLFSEAPLLRQSFFHPKPDAGGAGRS